MSEHKVARDTFYDIKPERVWLSLNNVCEKGKFKVTLEINGQSKELFNSYVEQGEVIVSEGHNLTWLFNSRNEEISRLHCFRAKDEELMNGAFDTISELKGRIKKLEAALYYCTYDDSYAVAPDGSFDVDSANEWKKMRAREALKND